MSDLFSDSSLAIIERQIDEWLAKMKSEDEHLVVYAPAILANAGYYQDAEELKLAADKEFL